MVLLHQFPLFYPIWLCLHMHKVAPEPILTMTFLEKRVATLCLVWIICVLIDLQLMGSMRKLTLCPVRTNSFLSKVSAQTTFQLWLVIFLRFRTLWKTTEVVQRTVVRVFVSFSGDLRHGIELDEMRFFGCESDGGHGTIIRIDIIHYNRHTFCDNKY